MVTSKNILCTIVLIVILGVLFVELLNSAKPKHPDADLNIEQLIRKHGYPLETHQVTTDDGYILTLHRIPHGRNESLPQRIPILFMHGFIQSATDFINLGPEKALSFLLANKGYDIWLGNARGTTWSRKHKRLNPNKDSEFWDYSVHEIGLHDLPAFIDYILETTRQNKLHYVGYSQGTTIFFILASGKPQYADKVKLATALAPAIFLKDVKSPLLNGLVYFRRLIENLIEIFGNQELFSSDSLMSVYLKHICDENSIFVDLCLHHIFNLQGYNPEYTNKTMLSLMFSNTPAGVSPKQIVHIIQLMESGNFHQYDLGIEGNLKKYGQREPPTYDLTNVTTPVALYYSNNDWTINEKNIHKITETLPNVVKSYLVPFEKFNHNDFIYADDVVKFLYNSVIEEILKY